MSAALSRHATWCRKPRSRWRASDAAPVAMCSPETDATSHEDGACCAPSASGPSSAAPRTPSTATRIDKASTDGMVLLGGSRFLMGTDDPVRYAADGEGPVR